jgi:transposase-like protein
MSIIKLKRRVDPMAVTECVTFYEVTGDEIMKTESMNFETLSGWMEVANVRLVSDYKGTPAGKVMDFLKTCEWTRNEQGLMCSIEFLALVGKKKFPSKCWVLIK